MRNLKVLALAAAVITLTACGGGGGAALAVANVSSEGFWTGVSSSGVTVNVAILENGETWGVYTQGNTLVGAVYGTSSSSGNAVSGSGQEFDLGTRKVTAGTYSGTVSAKTSISLATSGGAKFTGTYNAAYDTAASLASLAGSYTGFGVTGATASQSTPVTISASGAVTATGVGCTAAGTATPRASGKNIFDLSITFTGASCALGSGTVAKGVAYFDAPNKQILAMALNPAKTDGFIYVGTRP